MVRLITAVALAAITLVARVTPAQTTQIEADLQLAQDILGRLATEDLTQVGRESLQAELRRVEGKEHVVRMTLVARPYTAGSGYFPVKVSRKGLLEPALDGRIEMPRSKSRRAKSQLNPAYGTVRIHVVDGATPRATTVLTSVWVKVDGDVWHVISEDARLRAPSRVHAAPEPTDEVVKVRFIVPFDEGDGRTVSDSSDVAVATIHGDGQWVEGKYGSALDLNGSVQLRFDRTDMPFPVSNTVTVGAWMKVEPREGWQVIAEALSGRWFLGVHGTTPAFHIWGSTDASTHFAETRIVQDRWFHLAVSYDTQNVLLYVNGDVAKRGTAPDKYELDLLAMLEFGIGVNIEMPKERADVTLDDLFISDEVLTQAQIVQVMNGFVAPKVAEEDDANTPTWRSRAVLAAQGDAEARAVAFLSESALAVGYSDGQVRIWDVDTGGISATLPGPSEVMAIRAVPKGNRLFVAYLHTIRVWSVERREVLQTLGGELGRTWCLSVDSNGQRVLAGDEAMLYGWDLEAGPVPTHVIVDVFPRAAALSPDGNRVAIWVENLDGETAILQLRDVASQQATMSYPALPLRHRWATSVEFSPDGEQLAYTRDNSVYLTDIGSSSPPRNLGNGVVVAFSRDGEYLAATDSSYGQRCRLWSARTGQLVQSLADEEQPAPFANSLAFSPSSRLIAIPSMQGFVRLWKSDHETATSDAAGMALQTADVYRTDEQGVERARIRAREILALADPKGEFETAAEHHSRLAKLESSRRDLLLVQTASAEADVGIQVGAYNADEEYFPASIHGGTLVPRFAGRIPVRRSLAKELNPNGWQAAVSIGVRWASVAVHDVTVTNGDHSYGFEGWLPSGTWTHGIRQGRADFWSLVVSPDLSQLVFSRPTLREDRHIPGVVWDFHSGARAMALEADSHGVAASNGGLTFSPDGSWIIGTHQSNLRVWDAVTGRRIHEFDGRAGTRVAVDTDGTMFGSAHYGVKFWDAQTGSDLPMLPTASDQTWVVDFSPDGRYVATGERSNHVRLWDTSTGQELFSADTGGHDVQPIAFSADSQFVAYGQILSSASEDDLHVEVRATSNNALVQTVAPGYAHTIEFSPSGRSLLTGVTGGGVRLWDVRSGQQLHHFRDDHVGHFVGSDDEIVVGSQDGKISLWRNVGDSDKEPLRRSGSVFVHIPDPALERALRDALNQPKGPLADSALGSLEELHASNAGITDLTGIEHCTQLTVLDLNRNEIADVSPLAGLTSLRVLRLWDNAALTSIEPLASLTHLSELGVKGVLVADLRPLAQLTSLTILRLSVKDNDLSPLASLSKLEDIAIEVGQDTDFGPLATLEALVDVDIYCGTVPDTYPSIGTLSVLSLRHLRRFSLRLDNHDMSDISGLAAVTNLTDLRLDHCEIADLASLATMTDLVRLDISENEISDLQPLVDNAGFGDGAALRLGGNPLSQRAMQEQLPALARRGVNIEGVDVPPHATVVVIPDANLERVIRQALGKPEGALLPSNLATLTTLEAPDEGIYDLAGIEYCADLTTLDLSRNSITDPSPLASLTALKILRLSSANLPDLAFLAPLDGLETLWIGGNALSDLGGLSHLANLGELLIDGIPVRDIAPLAELHALHSLFFAFADPDDWSPIHQLRSLEALRIDSTPQRDLSFLSTLTGLRALGLAHCGIEKLPDLTSLRRLQSLYLDDNRITSIATLRRMELLEGVNLNYNMVTDISPLVDNPGIGPGDVISLAENPLSRQTLTAQVPALIQRGVILEGVALDEIPDRPAPAAVDVSVDAHPPQLVVSGDAALSTIHAPTAQTNASTPPAVVTHVLLAGVNAYDHHPSLSNPIPDVEAVEKELREAYRCTTQTLANPTQVEFLTVLRQLAERTYDEDEQLMVVFSGHGYFDETTKRGYLAFKDSRPLDEDPLFRSFVSHEDVRVLLERLDCEHVLLIVDSCFSGTLDPYLALAPGARAMTDTYGLVPREEFLRRKLQYRTRRYITAGGKEYVPDGRPGHHSPFARQILAGLRSFGGSDGILTFEEMVLYLERVDPQPRTGELFGNEPGSSFVLVAQPIIEQEPKFGSLIIDVTPADAKVEIEWGPPSAQPVLKTLNVQPVASSTRRFHLPFGQYRFRASSDGYRAQTREIEIAPGSTTVRIVLLQD
ncbi:hypothetical protein HN371_07915 [Candidatus Poribacteria bacterium]|nr:hypothetical protein [Candidatus Poribacteria bacterium]